MICPECGGELIGDKGVYTCALCINEARTKELLRKLHKHVNHMMWVVGLKGFHGLDDDVAIDAITEVQLTLQEANEWLTK